MPRYIRSPNKDKRTFHYFEAKTMSELHQSLEQWNSSNEGLAHSISIKQDNNKFCCILLASPMENIDTYANKIDSSYF